MRRVIAWVATTLDGYMEGPGGDLGWLMPHVNDAVPANTEMLREAETLLLGHVTYQGFAGYWPSQEGEFAELMNKPEKLIASESELGETPWGDFNNARQLENPVEASLRSLKQDDGGAIVILASGGLVSSLLPTGLIDELRVLLCPAVTSSGKPYIRNLPSNVELDTRSVQQLAGGALVLTYAVKTA